MVTKAQEQARADMYAELKALQMAFQENWADGSLPATWNEIPALYPIKPNKVKVTLSLDEDMVKWFRKLGRGYQARVNGILRVYWQGLLSGQIKAHWDPDAVGPNEHSLLEDVLKRKIAEINGTEGEMPEDLAVLEKGLSESLEMVQRVHRNQRGSDPC